MDESEKIKSFQIKLPFWMGYWQKSEVGRIMSFN